MASQKQKDARKRNWQIMQLRGAWCNLNSIMYSPWKYDALKAIDNQLRHMGAETQTARRKQKEQEFLDGTT